SCALFYIPSLLRPPYSPLFPYTTLFRSRRTACARLWRASARAEPISPHERCPSRCPYWRTSAGTTSKSRGTRDGPGAIARTWSRSEEHTSELQSRGHLVCRLLLEKKKDT